MKKCFSVIVCALSVSHFLCKKINVATWRYCWFTNGFAFIKTALGDKVSLERLQFWPGYWVCFELCEPIITLPALIHWCHQLKHKHLENLMFKMYFLDCTVFWIINNYRKFNSLQIHRCYCWIFLWSFYLIGFVLLTHFKEIFPLLSVFCHLLQIFTKLHVDGNCHLL